MHTGGQLLFEQVSVLYYTGFWGPLVECLQEEKLNKAATRKIKVVTALVNFHVLFTEEMPNWINSSW